MPQVSINGFFADAQAANAQVYKHSEKLGVKNIATHDLKAFNLCQTYTVAKPIMTVIAKYIVFIPIIGNTGSKVISALIAGLDAYCGSVSAKK